MAFYFKARVSGTKFKSLIDFTMMCVDFTMTVTSEEKKSVFRKNNLSGSVGFLEK